MPKTVGAKTFSVRIPPTEEKGFYDDCFYLPVYVQAYMGGFSYTPFGRTYGKSGSIKSIRR